MSKIERQNAPTLLEQYENLVVPRQEAERDLPARRAAARRATSRSATLRSMTSNDRLDRS
jgi:hypothetical protein